MALHLYRRHRVSCPHRSQTYRRCQCPIYAKGTLAKTYVRMSLDLTNWDAATKLIGQWTIAGQVGSLHQPNARTLAETVAAYERDLEIRGLSLRTRRSKAFLLRVLMRWAVRHGSTLLTDLTPARLAEFRASWTTWSPVTRHVYQKHYASVFQWCVTQGWLETNPADALSPIKVPVNPTLPFTADEMARILDACDAYVQAHPGTRALRHLRTFVLMLRWTGLRISDVTRLEWAHVRPDGTVFLYTQKTGTPVTVPIPAPVLAAFNALPRVGRYPFWNGTSALLGASGYWQQGLLWVFRHAGIANGHAHRFRDTFAVELLLAGVDIKDVSVLLGHSTTQITEKHYSPWVSARQSRLEAAVRASFATAPVPGPPPTPEPPA